MDEPLSNLDAQLRVQMRAEIQKLQRELGVTTIYVTHDQTEAMTMGDRIAVMQKGVLQQIGTPERLYTRPANVFVATFIGSPSMSVVPAGDRGRPRRATRRLQTGAHPARRDGGGVGWVRRPRRGGRVPRRRAARAPAPGREGTGGEASRVGKLQAGTRESFAVPLREHRSLRLGERRDDRLGRWLRVNATTVRSHRSAQARARSPITRR